MPLTADLTSADLNEIRQSALGAADPLGVAGELADAADSGRLADLADAGYALALAAEIAESRTKLDAALRYVERALEAYGKRDDSRVAAARALRARVLFRVGREDAAMAELEPLRPLLTQYPDAAAYISAALAAGGRNRLAEQWLTEAAQSALADRAGSAEPTSADLVFFLLQQRHRLRHVLGMPHDSHDNLAERLESKLTSTAADEQADVLVFWPRAEFDQVVTRWPVWTEADGDSWDEHRARVERGLSGGREVRIGSVAGLIAYSGKDGDPADPSTRAGYAGRLAGQISWPPERNALCWCGSGNKYKKCCLPRGRG